MIRTARTLFITLYGCTLLFGWGRCDLPKVPDEDITPPPLAVNSNGWRPLLPSSEKTTIPPSSRATPLQHPVLSKFQAHMLTAERNKRLHSTAASNKVETYIAAPPSILGSFSVFGHATMKTRDKTKNVPELLMPPPVLQAESKQHFRYERPAEESRPSFYFQEPSKSKFFFPSQQIGEFPAASPSYSTLGDAESFEPYYKTFSRTTTKFGEGDVKFLPQSVGIQVSGSTPFSQPGRVQDVPLRPTRLGSASSFSTGPNLSDSSKRPDKHTYILPGSTPLTSFEDQVYVTTWPPARPQQQQEYQKQQYFSKPSLRPVESYRVTRPYFQEDTKKNRYPSQFVAEQDENVFLPTQTPSSQTYIRKPNLSEQTTLPPTHINEVRIRKPLLPTPLTEEEGSEPPRDLYLYPEDQNEVRVHQSQRIRQPVTSPPQVEEMPDEDDDGEQAYQPRRPANRRPEPPVEENKASMRVRRPGGFDHKQPAADEGNSPRVRRPVTRNKPVEDDFQKQRKRRPIQEQEVTTHQPIPTEEEAPTPIPIDSSSFHSRKRLPAVDRGRGRDRTRARPQPTEKPTTEAPWDSDDYAYDPELQSTSEALYEPHTINEVTDDDFMSTKSGLQPTTTSTTTTTTTTSTTTTPQPSTTSRPRFRFPNNATRPRFSLKDHKERLERLSALTRKSTAENEDVSKTKPADTEASRGRTRSRASPKHEEEVNTTRVWQRGRQRPSTTSTTTEAPATTEPSTTTERMNHFKPTRRYRPGASKYYSGYRTRTTEAATDAETSASSTTLQTVVKPKPVFSVTRKPYPLRTRPLRVSTTSTTTELTPPVEEDSAVSASEPEVIVTEPNAQVTNNEAPKATENEVAPVMTDKADTTTTAGSEPGPPQATDPPSPEPETLSPSQIVADLTSSANSGGYFSNRSNLRITMATEDPILPIEAFFPVRSSRDVLT